MNQEHQTKPLLFHDKCSGFFYVHYLNNLVHRTYSLMSHPKQLWLSVLLTDTKSRDRPVRDSNPHSDNARTWVWCIRLLFLKVHIIERVQNNYLNAFSQCSCGRVISCNYHRLVFNIMYWFKESGKDILIEAAPCLCCSFSYKIKNLPFHLSYPTGLTTNLGYMVHNLVLF